MSLLKRNNKKTPKHLLFVIGGVFILTLVIALGIHLINTTTSSGESAEETPSFTALTPNGASIESFGGWQRISPPETEPVFVYTDTINGTSISVSQQPLPPQFQTDTANQLDQLAQGYGATEKISSDPEIFVGASAQGPQSVITSKSGLLILVTSKTGIENDAWIQYINALR